MTSRSPVERTWWPRRVAAKAVPPDSSDSAASKVERRREGKKRLVDQLTPSSNTPRDSNTLCEWLREVAAIRQAAQDGYDFLRLSRAYSQPLVLGRLISQALSFDAADAAGEVGFLARALVPATLLRSDPKTNEFVRHNGHYSLSILTPKGVGLP